VTKYFTQGRDLSEPLVEVPSESAWYRRVGLRLFSGYLWFLFGFGAFAIVVWVLVILIS
jgi:hypothetical protein